MMRSISPRMLSLTAALLFGLGSSACGDGTEDGSSSSGGSASADSSNSTENEGSSGDEGKSGATSTDGSAGKESTPGASGNSTPTSEESSSGKETSDGETTSSTKSSSTTTSGETSAEPEPQKITLEKDIQPIFNDSCGCHVSNAAGGLTLKAGEAYGALLNKTGTKVGTLLTPNDPSKSAVYGVTAHTVEPVMPKNKPKIAADKIKLMEDWIKGGALEK